MNVIAKRLLILLILNLHMPANAQELLTKVNGGASWQLPEINGNTSFASNNFKASTANSYLMGTDDYLLFVNSSDASASIELPDPTKCQGRMYLFIKTTSSNSLIFSNYSIKVSPNSSKSTFNGNNIKLSIVSDGTDWWQLEG
ncbi:MAG: hypothetical protein P8P81_08810 [Bacteroidia bacterium]|nr:hypothetical protein [Bacteroidia bacterium]